MVGGLGSRVQTGEGSWFRFEKSVSRVLGLGFQVRVEDSGFRDQVSGFRVWGLVPGLRVESLGLQFRGLGLRI